MADANVRGRFVWHELYTPNPAGAHEFYGKTVGWKSQAWDQDPGYVMFTAPTGPIGAPVRVARRHAAMGTVHRNDQRRRDGRGGDAPRRPCGDCPDAAAERRPVRDSHRPARRQVRHPCLGLAAAGRAARLGEFSWHELATTVAPGIAFGFYGALFDWDEISETDMGPMGMYLVFGRNGRQLGGMFDKGAAGKPGAAYWLGYVSVTDLEDTVDRPKPRAARCSWGRWTCRAAIASRSSWTRMARSSRCTRPRRKPPPRAVARPRRASRRKKQQLPRSPPLRSPPLRSPPPKSLPRRRRPRRSAPPRKRRRRARNPPLVRRRERSPRPRRKPRRASRPRQSRRRKAKAKKKAKKRGR